MYHWNVCFVKQNCSQWQQFRFQWRQTLCICRRLSSTRQLNGQWPAMSTTNHNYHFKSEFITRLERHRSLTHTLTRSTRNILNTIIDLFSRTKWFTIWPFAIGMSVGMLIWLIQIIASVDKRFFFKCTDKSLEQTFWLCYIDCLQLLLLFSLLF